MSYKIEALPPFAKEVKYLAKRYKSLKEDILRLRDELLENPLSGTDLGGGGNHSQINSAVHACIF